MSPVADGFTPIRNGLLEHLRDGRLTLLEFAVYVLLHMRADWSTGVYRGCALTLAYEAGDPMAREQIKQVLRRLKAKRYINYPRGTGARGGYDVLIHKFQPREGPLTGTRLDAWKHGQKCSPEYQSLAGAPPETSRSVTAQSPDAPPNKEIRSKNEEELPGNEFKTKTTEELKAMKKVIEQGTGKPAPQELRKELEQRDMKARADLNWQEVLAQLAITINPHTFDTWFKPSRGISIGREGLTVLVPTPGFAQMLERYRDSITLAMQQVGLPYRGIVFVPVGFDIHASAEPAAPKHKASRTLVMSLLIAYATYERRLFRTRLSTRARRIIRLVWAALNISRCVQSFTDLTTGEVRTLMEIITGLREDAIRREKPKRHAKASARNRKPRQRSRVHPGPRSIQ